MKEVWKSIEGYEKSYQVSNLGNVRSIDRVVVGADGKQYKKQGKLMKLIPASKNDVTSRVELNSGNNYKSYYIASLVAAAFLGVPYCSSMIHHIDGNYNNNVVSNLTTDISKTLWYNDKITDDEEWRDVVGYEGTYQVSSCGRFRSLPRMIPHSSRGYNFRKGVIHSYLSSECTDTYISVQLWSGGKAVQRPLHRLIAEAFIPNSESRPVVNHKDGNKRNNHIDNLEWVTHKENSQHAIATGLNAATGLGKPVRCLTTGVDYLSISEAAKDLNIDHHSVVEAAIRRTAYAGYEFEYI